MYRSYLFLLLITIVFSNCLVIEHPNAGLAPGIWRAELQLQRQMVKAKPRETRDRDATIERRGDDFDQRILPFIFEVIQLDDSTHHFIIHNGEERIRVTDVEFGYDITQSKDTLLVKFPVYNSYIRARVEGAYMEGYWIDKNRENYSIPFNAEFGRDYRFSLLKKEPKTDISGRWEVTFSEETDDEFPAIGEFEQKGNHLTGTFLTETGDYRYLEGTIQENKLYLSTFDGAHAFLFQAKLTDDNTMVGSFKSGKHYTTTWTATRNENAKLSDPDSLTYFKEGYDYLSFAFPTVDGDTLGYDSRGESDKPTLIQILGTWCPNCRDETAWLSELLKRPEFSELNVIGLAFEKQRNKQKAMQGLRTYSDKMDLNYPLLLAGSSNKIDAGRALPQLNHILSYPTLIIIDKQGKVRKIHTGFSGPATSAYASNTQKIEELLRDLIAE